MTQYSLNSSPQTAASHRFLIGPPLFVVSLFCFGFVLMQPHTSTPTGAATSSHSSLPASNKTDAPLAQASQASLQKLSPAPVTSSTVSVTAGTSVSSTGSAATSTLSATASQASNTGATATLQSASPTNQTTLSGTKTTQTFKTTFTNLLNSSLKLIR